MRLSTAFLALSAAVLLVLISRDLVLAKRYCSFFYYYSKAKKDCTLCTDMCGKGMGLTKNCGFDEFGNRRVPACSPCQEGYFSQTTKFSYLYRPSPPCQPCKQCHPASRTKRTCTATRNAKCRRCPRGMYKRLDGHCYKCSYCCDGMLESGRNVVQSCKRKGMGRCSCTATTRCYDGSNGNKQCDKFQIKKKGRQTT